MRRFVHGRDGQRTRPSTQRVDAPEDGDRPWTPTWRLTEQRRLERKLTRLALAGDVDEHALEALESAVRRAHQRGDAIALDLGELTSCPPGMAAAYRAAREDTQGR